MTVTMQPVFVLNATVTREELHRCFAGNPQSSKNLLTLERDIASYIWGLRGIIQLLLNFSKL